MDIEQAIIIASKNVLNVEELALWRGLSVDRINKLAAARLIPCYKCEIDGKLYFKKAEIEEFLCSIKRDCEAESQLKATEWSLRNKKAI